MRFQFFLITLSRGGGRHWPQNLYIYIYIYILAGTELGFKVEGGKYNFLERGKYNFSWAYFLKS